VNEGFKITKLAAWECLFSQGVFVFV